MTDKATSIARMLETSTVHEIRETARKTPSQVIRDAQRMAAQDAIFGIAPGDKFSPEGLRKLGARYSVGDPDGEME